MPALPGVPDPPSQGLNIDAPHADSPAVLEMPTDTSQKDARVTSSTGAMMGRFGRRRRTVDSALSGPTPDGFESTKFVPDASDKLIARINIELERLKSDLEKERNA